MRLERLIGCRTEQVVGMFVRVQFVTPRLQAVILACRASRGRLAAALQALQFHVEVERFQRLGGERPVLVRGGAGLAGDWLGCDRRFDQRFGRCSWYRHRRCAGSAGAVLLQQLPGGVEHLQAVATAHYTAGHAQLVVGDAKAGLAMRALGDETVGHAAIRELCRKVF
ncbi:hypothetical protein PPS11_11191 [Pseudomonas putida S11]|nr:hypothetical protein PPS11_11191 [Pseudomonas putida S11]